MRHGVMRRETSWFSVSASGTSLAGASTAVLASSLNAAGLALRPFTIVRTRGYMHVSSDQQAASENYSVALGYAVVSDQAVAIGVTAVPTPTTDRGSDLWYVYEEIYGRVAFSDATGIREVGHGREFDSKAMRKVEVGQDVISVVETTVASSGALITEGGRYLVKLH